MSPQDEHVTLIGPWGWLGWFLLVAVATLYVHLWNSTGNRARIKLQEEVEDARRVIKQLKEENAEITKLKDFYKQEVSRIEVKMQEMDGRIAEMEKANSLLRGHMTGLAGQLKHEKNERDNLFQRVIELEAQRGSLN